MNSRNLAVKTAIKILVILSAMQLCGCALLNDTRNLHVTYKTDLAGATLLQGDQYIGTTPITLTRRLSREQYETGTVTIEPMTILWASGAGIEIPAETIYFANGLYYEFTYLRPKNAPNMQVDIAMAQLEETRAARIAAENRAAELELQNEIMARRLSLLEQQRQEERIRNMYKKNP